MRKVSRMPEKPANNFAGIEVAMTTMRGVLISEAGQTLDRRESNYEPESLIKSITDLAGELRRAGEIKAVGLAIPGLVSRETDRVLVSTGLPFTAREHIHSELMEATGIRFELENDANAAAYGEYKAGAGRDARGDGAGAMRLATALRKHVGHLGLRPSPGSGRPPFADRGAGPGAGLDRRAAFCACLGSPEPPRRQPANRRWHRHRHRQLVDLRKAHNP